MGNVSISNEGRGLDQLNINGRPDPRNPDNFRKALRDIGAGWADENIFGLGFKNIVDATVNSNPIEFVEDKNYDVTLDPQLIGLEEYMGNFYSQK